MTGTPGSLGAMGALTTFGPLATGDPGGDAGEAAAAAGGVGETCDSARRAPATNAPTMTRPSAAPKITPRIDPRGGGGGTSMVPAMGVITVASTGTIDARCTFGGTVDETGAGVGVGGGIEGRGGGGTGGRLGERVRRCSCSCCACCCCRCRASCCSNSRWGFTCECSSNGSSSDEGGTLSRPGGGTDPGAPIFRSTRRFG
jgi:hypothetical protein